jgi:hypothetical protein
MYLIVLKRVFNADGPLIHSDVSRGSLPGRASYPVGQSYLFVVINDIATYAVVLFAVTVITGDVQDTVLNVVSLS